MVDTPHRRRRTAPQSTGKRLTPQPRDLLWFEKLQEHGPLPSSFLLAYSKATHRSEKRAKERLTDLFNEDRTPHGGTYLSRPSQQYRTVDSLHNQLVYDLTPASRAALVDHGANRRPRCLVFRTLTRKRAHQSGYCRSASVVSLATASSSPRVRPIIDCLLEGEKADSQLSTQLRTLRKIVFNIHHGAKSGF